MENKSLTLFEKDIISLLNLKKAQIDKEIKEIKKYPGFTKDQKVIIKGRVYDNLKIGTYPLLGEESKKSEIIQIREDEAQRLIPGLATTLNNRLVELRKINVSLKFSGESTLLNYGAETIGRLIVSGYLYSNSISLDFYIPITGTDEEQAQNFKTQKNNNVHLIKTRMEEVSKAFDSIVQILKEDIDSKIEKEFNDIDNASNFDKLLD